MSAASTRPIGEDRMYVKDPGRLRRRRTTKGLTQRQLAALVGSTQQYISLLESGKDRDCSERITLKLCRWLEVDPDDYFEERLSPGPEPFGQ
jgi:transcriptional regulator with XRE-family HTH domain